ncbi:hypothetical protein [Nocardia sp. XZ_19_385]|uniref:hypothetical protein n=1 Tax=Nocardia sp. XZ_19_385 TaxID=2769488 RepID=UPI00188DF64C|nr:hypothetical protein [Nocardia sp. XZ_19_385]
MDVQQSEVSVRSLRRRAAILAVCALPLAVAVFGAGTAAAEDPPPGPEVVESAPAAPDPLAFLQTLIPVPAPAPVVEAIPAVIDEPPAPIDTDRIRIGDTEVDRPEWLPVETAAQINDAAGGAETALSSALQLAGLEPWRAGRVADDVLGSAAVGAAVGTVVAGPVASTGALIGVVAGLVAGLPFAPIGLVIVPVIGAILGYAMVAAPFAAVGAVVGAAAGAVEGMTAAPPA